jgi:hypothetical protein
MDRPRATAPGLIASKTKFCSASRLKTGNLSAKVIMGTRERNVVDDDVFVM